MPKHTVVTMPGDGIGNQVLPEAIRVLERRRLRRRIHSCRHRMGLLVPRRQCAPERTSRTAAPSTNSDSSARSPRSRRKQAEAELDARTPRQGLLLLQPDRHDAAEVQSRYLHAPLHLVSRQSAEFHSQAAGRRLRRATGQRRRFPPEHRRPVCRSRVDESAGASSRCSRAPMRNSSRLLMCPAPISAISVRIITRKRGAQHLQGRIRIREEERLQVRHHLREAERSARNLRHDGRSGQGSVQEVSRTSRSGPPTSMRRPCG